MTVLLEYSVCTALFILYNIISLKEFHMNYYYPYNALAVDDGFTVSQDINFSNINNCADFR